MCICFGRWPSNRLLYLVAYHSFSIISPHWSSWASFQPQSHRRLQTGWELSDRQIDTHHLPECVPRSNRVLFLETHINNNYCRCWKHRHICQNQFLQLGEFKSLQVDSSGEQSELFIESVTRRLHQAFGREMRPKKAAKLVSLAARRLGSNYLDRTADWSSSQFQDKNLTSLFFFSQSCYFRLVDGSEENGEKLVKV